MQTIQNIKNGIKNIFITTVELLHVRLEMAMIEMKQQKAQLLVTLVSLLFAFILLLTALTSGLFALNALLENPQDRLQAFLIISAVCVLILFVLIYILLNSLKKQRSFMNTTLTELKRDIAVLKKLAEKPDVSQE